MSVNDLYPTTPQRLHAVAGTDIEAEIPYEVHSALESSPKSKNVSGILREAAKELFGLVRVLNAKRITATLHQSVGDALHMMGTDAGIEDNEIQKLIGEGE